MEAPNTRDTGTGGETTSNSSHRLFDGKQFWLSQNIPQRSRFKEMIQQHGGIIRLQEKDADILLVDHARKNLPANSYSYRYIERSVSNGRLENLEAYRAGPSAHRPEGATNITRRTYRLPYTLEDDQQLWDYMQQFENEGFTVSGRKVYQEFADMNPRHTYQSYRDHYLKKLRGRPRPGGMPPSMERPTSSGESTRRSEERPQITTGLTSSTQEGRKRKRSPDEEPSESHIPKNPVTPSQKRRTVDTNQEARTPTARQPQREEPERAPPVPIPTTQVARNPEPEPEQEPEPAQPPAIIETKLDNGIDPLFLELPFLPSSPEPEEEAPAQDIDTWINHRLRTGKAKTTDQVVAALRCASMDPTLADQVLQYLAAGKGIPTDMRGVWTAEDDQSIEGQDARDIDRVLKKHGGEYFNIRWEYLGMARAAGLE